MGNFKKLPFPFRNSLYKFTEKDQSFVVVDKHFDSYRLKVQRLACNRTCTCRSICKPAGCPVVNLLPVEGPTQALVRNTATFRTVDSAETFAVILGSLCIVVQGV